MRGTMNPPGTHEVPTPSTRPPADPASGRAPRALLLRGSAPPRRGNRPRPPRPQARSLAFFWVVTLEAGVDHPRSLDPLRHDHDQKSVRSILGTASFHDRFTPDLVGFLRLCVAPGLSRPKAAPGEPPQRRARRLRGRPDPRLHDRASYGSGDEPRRPLGRASRRRAPGPPRSSIGEPTDRSTRSGCPRASANGTRRGRAHGSRGRSSSSITGPGSTRSSPGAPRAEHPTSCAFRPRSNQPERSDASGRNLRTRVGPVSVVRRPSAGAMPSA